jgi:2-methylcitrate dehydratase PrpD
VTNFRVADHKARLRLPWLTGTFPSHAIASSEFTLTTAEFAPFSPWEIACNANSATAPRRNTRLSGPAELEDSWAREYHAGNAALCAVNAALAAGRGYTVNADMLEARGGFFAVFGDAKPDTNSLTRESGKAWDIVEYLAIKLVPGAHAFQSTAEAAVDAARQTGVAPEDVARILVSGSQSRSIAGNERPPRDMVEAIHSLRYSWPPRSPTRISHGSMRRQRKYTVPSFRG